MIKAINILVLCVLVNSCELITIGKKQVPVLEINQKSPMGVVYLFKLELDSNNIPAATQVLAREDGGYYLALEKYEMYDDVARIGRMIARKPITDVITDSLSPTEYMFRIEFDYLRKLTFKTSMINDNWFIVNYSED